MPVVHEGVHRQQLDGGDAEPLQVVDHRRVREPGVGPAQLGRNLGVALGEAPDVQFVDHRLVPGAAQLAVAHPVEEGLLDDAVRHEGRALHVVAHVRTLCEGIGMHRLVEADHAVERLGVGVEQELGRVAAVAACRLPGAVHPEAVALSRDDRREVAVPAVPADLREVDAGFAARLVEQAELDAGGDFREQREVGAGAVEGRPQGEGGAGPDFHVHGGTRRSAIK